MGLGDGQKANLLHLVTQALGKGYARLSKLFGNPANERREIEEPAQLTAGTLESDVQTELKRHFVLCILGREEGPELKDSKKLDAKFKQINDLIRHALERKQNPYVASWGPKFRKLEETIKGQLEMKDLLLIYPGGDRDIDELISNPIFVFKSAYAIFEMIEARLKRS
jgi:hypothetical protein